MANASQRNYLVVHEVTFVSKQKAQSRTSALLVFADESCFGNMGEWTG